MGFLQVTRRLIAEQDSELETSLVMDREKVSKLYNTEWPCSGQFSKCKIITVHGQKSKPANNNYTSKYGHLREFYPDL